MAVKKNVNDIIDENKTEKVVPLKKSRRLIGLFEFLHSVHLRVEQQAGFRVFTKDKPYRTRDEWKEKLLEYQNRDLKEG